MKKILYTIVVCFCILSIASNMACMSKTGLDNKSESNGFVAGEILVKFKEDTPQETIKLINQKMGTSVIRLISTSLYLLKVPENSNIEEMIKRYNELPEVKYAEPNYRIKAL